MTYEKLTSLGRTVDIEYAKLFAHMGATEHGLRYRFAQYEFVKVMVNVVDWYQQYKSKSRLPVYFKRTIVTSE